MILELFDTCGNA